jgi:hypothetical protein
MAETVIEAFHVFVRDTVNLDRDVTARARASRDWLVGQIHGFHTDEADFPLSYSEKDIFYGSFHRRTKIRELDDVDLISCISAESATYLDRGGTVTITATPDSRLAAYCNDNSLEINSRKILNRFVRSLARIPQYRRADIERNGEAAVLGLSSYTWSFDIVPSFFTKPEADGRTYYLIPDAEGAWKKTDPRMDEARARDISTKFGNVALVVVRLAKYWNRRARIKTMGTYLLENIVLDYFSAKPVPDEPSDDFPDIYLPSVFEHIGSAVLGSVHDPKYIQGDLNDLEFSDRIAIRARALSDADIASRARAAEERHDHAAAIRLWRDIFGDEFPAYE